MELQIVNREPRYGPVQLVDPTPLGYILIGASVAPPANFRPTILPRSEQRQQLIARLKGFARQLDQLAAVRRVTVYRAVLLPPPSHQARQQAPHIARYDVAVLVETDSPEVISEVQAVEPYRLLMDAVREHSHDTLVMAARCVRCVGDVDNSRQGTFLFNYFHAEDADLALRLWDYLAGWYAVETRMDNSTLLQPIGESDYTMVNHARWDSLALLTVRQFAKKTFWTYVLANLKANRTVAMPILYRLA